MAFQLKPNKKESENKTIRFPIPLIHKIEAAIQNQDVTFSSFVIQACEYALHDLQRPDHSNAEPEKGWGVKYKKAPFIPICLREFTHYICQIRLPDGSRA